MRRSRRLWPHDLPMANDVNEQGGTGSNERYSTLLTWPNGPDRTERDRTGIPVAEQKVRGFESLRARSLRQRPPGSHQERRRSGPSWFAPGSLRALAPGAGDVAVGRAADGRRAVADDHAAPPAAVDPVEREPFHSARDVVDRALVERDEVGVAPHEGHPGPVLDDRDRVAGEQGTAALRPGRPVQHGGAVEVTADPGDGDAGHGLDLVVEELHPW